MGSYEKEMELVSQGKAQRGYTAQRYFAEIDKDLPEEATALTHRPDYSRTLFAPENDDIYREFCAYVDLPEPRLFSSVENPLEVEGFTADDVHRTMVGNNDKIVRMDGAAVYNMLVRLRTSPAIAKKVLQFKPTCYQNGCGCKDYAYEQGYYN